MTRSAILGLVCCVLLATGARAELNRDQLVELRGRLDPLADAVSAGQTNETHRLAAGLQRWARQQDASLPVDLICERALVFPPDNEARQLSASIRQLTGNLDSLLAQPSAGSDLAQARDTLAQVLAADEFRYTVQPGWWEQFSIRIWRWIDRFLRLIGSIPGAEKVANVMFYLAVALLLLPLLGAIGYLIWWQTKQRRDAPQVGTAAVARMLEPPDVHLSRAEEFVRQGQYVEALKQFHLAALAALEQRGLVAPDRTRTNWEYLAQLQSRPAPAESVSLLRALNALYDRAVFGTQPCDAALARVFGQQSQQLMRSIATGNSRA